MPSNVLLLDGWTVTSYSESPEQITFYADPPPSEKLCAHCKIPTLVVPHDERVLKIRDAPMRGKTVTIAVRQIRFRCRTCGKPFTPALPDLADDIPMTAHQIQKETERRARELSTRKAPKNGARHRIPKPVRTTLRLRMTKRCADFISVAAFRRPFAWVAREVGSGPIKPLAVTTIG